MREAPNNQPARFPTTRLSLILAASGEPTPQSQEALSTLCQIYWYPIYAYLRRRGYAADEAEDYTQGFFTLVLEKHYLRDFQHERGRFRSFLIGSIKHFLANHQNWERAQKRGGGVSAISLDEVIQAGEIRYGREPLDALTPEKLFERQWAFTVLNRVQTRLEEEAARSGKRMQFDRLKAFLTESEIRYLMAAIRS